MRKVVLDTNFLMLFGKFKLDLRNELERVVGEGFELFASHRIKEELGRIASGKNAEALNASLALSLIERMGVTLLPSQAPVDDWILENSEIGSIVCTNDKELARKLKDKGVRVIMFKGLSKLGFV